MFDDLADARAYLDEIGLAALADQLLPLLRPCIMVVPSADDPIGGTRTGGTPDLPAHLAWPTGQSADPAMAARAGGHNHGPAIATHLASNVPYAFAAQIDLAATASCVAAAALPRDGRLLFFYDSVAGPWRPADEAGKVVWDRSPAPALRRASLPPALAALYAAEKADFDRRIADPMLLANDLSAPVLAVLEKQLPPGQTLEDHFRATAALMGFTSQYVYPLRPMRLQAALQWPDRKSVEAEDMRDYLALLEDNAVPDDALARPEGLPATRRHVFAGVPMPEQDDPRYDAVAIADPAFAAQMRADRTNLGPQFQARARDWHLLLQLDQQALLDERFVEGIVCFVIHATDLARRDFSKVLTIYQQT